MMTGLRTETGIRVYAERPYTVSNIRSRPYLSEKMCETVCRVYVRVYGLMLVFSVRPYAETMLHIRSRSIG